MNGTSIKMKKNDVSNWRRHATADVPEGEYDLATDSGLEEAYRLSERELVRQRRERSEGWGKQSTKRGDR